MLVLGEMLVLLVCGSVYILSNAAIGKPILHEEQGAVRSLHIITKLGVELLPLFLEHYFLEKNVHFL